MNDNQKAVEALIQDVKLLEEKTQRLYDLMQRQVADARSVVIHQLLSSKLLELTPQQRRALEIMTDSRASQVVPMFVQPEEFNQWQSTGRNLLTISRSGSFPFTIPLTVVI